mmetsp:Transcript_41075/g.41960  ORF Transcript_41075/g.41960 Transcript_41075/m.41960 type:complete len:132 (-) Transcript_41075:224-619(-)|eukprot:CAMPEP_0182430004 /NCGR_PEP_ID=MMETSP1167-20130531/35823_1 /TAXON_ID=2988 /ORGANISM="Mallomonas Sp, Strain CCMP3275" /LENGTH=131 /DNA_ID=CAMNT_0024614503 /DNA_START=42 /DNA_END=437 /DNA_ORIENTATION=+
MTKRPANVSEGKSSESNDGKSSFFEILQKATTFEGNWDKDSFPEFPDVLFVVRQILGLFFGVMFGIFPVLGISAIIKFFVASMIMSFLYYARYVNVNIDDYGAGELATSGLQSSVGVFLLSWIGIYSAMHN